MTFIQTLAVKSCEIRMLKSEMIKMSYIGILWLNIISDFFFYYLYCPTIKTAALVHILCSEN